MQVQQPGQEQCVSHSKREGATGKIARLHMKTRKAGKVQAPHTSHPLKDHVTSKLGIHGNNSNNHNNSRQNASTSKGEHAAEPIAGFRTATRGAITSPTTATTTAIGGAISSPTETAITTTGGKPTLNENIGKITEAKHQNHKKRATKCGMKARAPDQTAHGSMAFAPNQAQPVSATRFEIASIAFLFFRRVDAALRTAQQQEHHRDRTPCHWEMPSHNNERRRPRVTQVAPRPPPVRGTSVVSFNKKCHPSVKL
jgi:organic radical activating enzyme